MQQMSLLHQNLQSFYGRLVLDRVGQSVASYSGAVHFQQTWRLDMLGCTFSRPTDAGNGVKSLSLGTSLIL